MAFEEISGHEKEAGILRNLLSSGRVPHALLFTGPEGIGKRLVALRLASALNCGSGGCGACEDCRLSSEGLHPNIMAVWPTVKVKENEYENALDGDGLIRVHQVREVQASLRYKAGSGRKVVIIDFAERLMPAAANAFLKTLEEPPAGSVIILVTSRPSELLATIHSRCQRISFKPLPEEAVSGYLVSKGVEPEAAGRAARLSCGSIGRALSLAAAGGDNGLGDIACRLAELSPTDTDGVLKLAEEVSKRDDLSVLLDSLMLWYRDRAVAAEGEARLAVDAEALTKVARPVHPMRLSEAYSALVRAKEEITPPRYANKQLLMENLLFSLAGL